MLVFAAAVVLAYPLSGGVATLRHDNDNDKDGKGGGQHHESPDSPRGAHGSESSTPSLRSVLSPGKYHRPQVGEDLKMWERNIDDLLFRRPDVPLEAPHSDDIDPNDLDDLDIDDLDLKNKGEDVLEAPATDDREGGDDLVSPPPAREAVSKAPIVCNNDNGTIKCGFAGDKAPARETKPSHEWYEDELELQKATDEKAADERDAERAEAERAAATKADAERAAQKKLADEKEASLLLTKPTSPILAPEHETNHTGSNDWYIDELDLDNKYADEPEALANEDPETGDDVDDVDLDHFNHLDIDDLDLKNKGGHDMGRDLKAPAIGDHNGGRDLPSSPARESTPSDDWYANNLDLLEPSPPCSCSILDTIDNPSPDPRCFVVVKGTIKSFGVVLKPTPLSSIII